MERTFMLKSLASQAEQRPEQRWEQRLKQHPK
jgi:hypothetical protein